MAEPSALALAPKWTPCAAALPEPLPDPLPEAAPSPARRPPEPDPPPPAEVPAGPEAEPLASPDPFAEPPTLFVAPCTVEVAFAAALLAWSPAALARCFVR